ncbi:N2,N2-dimethylguanosine tRNA methyltransferase [Vulcanococcus limneticus]|uniref:N2,N2-dimethylguanosine tRNA methyltransferase n=1 Tax=Vulcanococcus limneticus TaxID=2170428 RepID=UPI00398BFE00
MPLHAEGSVQLDTGSGFFRPDSRPGRDLGVLLVRHLARERNAARAELPEAGLRVLDAMAGCGIRALRYGQEAGATAVWANDADRDRLPLLEANLAPLEASGVALRRTALTAQKLLADCLLREERFDLLDLDAFGCPTPLVPLALEALAFGGVLYLASTDGRSPTGHDRRAAVRSLGAAARAHPASWELALRLQIGVVARAAWALGRGVRPLFSFSEGRTFRTAVQLLRRPESGEECRLGLIAHCHGCGEQLVQPLLTLRQWPACACEAGAGLAAAPGSGPGAATPPLAISGPLWLGPLQHPASLAAMAEAERRAVADGAPASLGRAGARLLEALRRDPGEPARCWPLAELGRRLGGGPPPLKAFVEALRAEGWSACPSGVMAGQLRSDAPWHRVLELAGRITAARDSPARQAPGPTGGTLNR